MAETDEDVAGRGQGQGDQWARDSLVRLAEAGLLEQRRTRRWGILFKSLVLLYLFLVLFAALNAGSMTAAQPSRIGEHTALVDVEGLIAADTDASADRVAHGLRDAFEDPDTKGVLIRINSPGGSPVQAGMIHDEILRLREEYPDIPVYAVTTDICASGGYYVAAAADKVFANRASMVGSIGVRLDSFGFVEAMDKLGVERRLITAGENKALLDPFLPVDPEQVAHIQGVIDEIHQQFITAVKQGRGDRLVDDPALFSGLIWTGEGAIAKGLVDELRTPGEVAREVIGAEDIVDFTPRKDFWQRLSERVGTAVGSMLEAGTRPHLE